MARIPPLPRPLSRTIPFARGVADRAARAVGPAVVGIAGRVASRLPGRGRPATSTPETFTPSPHADEPAPGATASVSTTHQVGVPSPAAVARNVSGPRPTAKNPARSKPRSVPGAKLPVTRPST